MADLSREQIEERIQTALNLMQELGFPANVNDEGFCGCGECRNCLVNMAHNSLDELTEALRQLLSATEWKPIETAPRDGTPILLWAPDYFENDPHADVGEWSDRVGAWSSEVGMMEDGPIGDDPDLCNGPDNWMPLPLPPSPLTEGE
jgi:hypothetical protein